MSLTKFTDIARKLPIPIYKLAAQSYVDLEFPRHIFIETTANCNLSCEYCPREKIKEDMDFELFKSIVDEASHYGPRSFSTHLFGEPLLYPRIIEALEYIKKKNRKHTILLTTNGTVLNHFAKKLRTRVDRVIWSYRANNFNQESISLLRYKGLIRLLIEETPKEEFERWSKFPRVEVKHVHNYGGEIDLQRIYGNIRQKDRDEVSRYPCYHLFLAPAIRWNGQIVQCCDDPHGKSAFGTYGLDGVNLASYWRSESLKRNRDGHKKGQYLGICKTCDVWKTYPDIFFGWQKHSHS